jgi:hypothetical protein
MLKTKFKISQVNGSESLPHSTVKFTGKILSPYSEVKVVLKLPPDKYDPLDPPLSSH